MGHGDAMSSYTQQSDDQPVGDRQRGALEPIRVENDAARLPAISKWECGSSFHLYVWPRLRARTRKSEGTFDEFPETSTSLFKNS